MCVGFRAECREAQDRCGVCVGVCRRQSNAWVWVWVGWMDGGNVVLVVTWDDFLSFLERNGGGGGEEHTNGNVVLF